MNAHQRLATDHGLIACDLDIAQRHPMSVDNT
jgi:hypothetical protein